MPNFGATYREWDTLSQKFGLIPDLLPVVSNPSAVICAQSTLKQLGKTPSRYNAQHEVVGIADWTSKISMLEEVTRWKKETDYGICIQTRSLRAIDIDVKDEDTVIDILLEIGISLPIRSRGGARCLLAFFMPEALTKRVIRLPGEEGIIELLATGQQFIAAGTHPSGSRYEWRYKGQQGLPEAFPYLTREKLEDIWARLAKRFGVSQTEAKASTKAQVLHEAITSDPTAQFLVDNDWVKSSERDGRLHIRCPFESEHTCESADSSTTYFPAHTGGYVTGHFDCKHGHCGHRTDADFISEIGVPMVDAFAEFDDLDAPAAKAISDINNFDIPPAVAVAEKKTRFSITSAEAFSERRALDWIIKGVLPKAEVAVIFGDSASGKTFLALDMLAAIARGDNWRGLRTKQGQGVYICAEGAGGMGGRLKAYAQHNQITLDKLPIGIIADAPNLTQVQDIKDLIRSVKTLGPVSVVVVDTFAQAMAGANENSGEDVGKALAHCRVLHQHTGALVLLVHHSGKNSDKGARGWSGLRAAADAEIEVIRHDNMRHAKVTKMKDGQDGAEFGFKLSTITIGLDEDGDAVTSCVVEEAEITHEAKAEKTDIVKARIMRNVTDTVGVTSNGMDASLVIENVVESMIPPAEGKRDNRREKVMTALTALQEMGAVVICKGRIFLPDMKGADDG